MTGREVLLVIIAMAVVVAGVILFLQLKNQDAQRAQSARNLMQWSIALQMHLLENNNLLPAAGGPAADQEIENAWYNALPRYLGIPSPLNDTSLTSSNDLQGPLAIWYDPAFDEPLFTQSRQFIFTYGMNRYLQPDTDRSPYRIHELSNPAVTIFMAEQSGTDPGILPQDIAVRYRRGDNPAANVLYCDGHVELVDSTAIVSFEAWPDVPVLDGITTWSPFPDAPEPDWNQLDR